MTKSVPRRRSRRAPAPVPAEVSLAVAAAVDKKAADLIVLDLRKAQAFTDFFIICTGTSTRQVEAIAAGIRRRLTEAGTKPSLVEGLERAEWVLLDYFDFVVHVFTPSTRDFYSLERLWGDAERVDVPA